MLRVILEFEPSRLECNSSLPLNSSHSDSFSTLPSVNQTMASISCSRCKTAHTCVPLSKVPPLERLHGSENQAIPYVKPHRVLKTVHREGMGQCGQ